MENNAVHIPLHITSHFAVIENFTLGDIFIGFSTNICNKLDWLFSLHSIAMSKGLYFTAVVFLSFFNP